MQQRQSKILIRVALDQKNPDGSIKTKEINGKVYEMKGGVVEDNIGAILGYVYNEDKYDRDLIRKKEAMIQVNWI